MGRTDQFLRLDDALTLATRHVLPAGAGRWERWLKIQFIHVISKGFRVGLNSYVLTVIIEFEKYYDSLTDCESHMLNADKERWGFYETDWNWIALADETFFIGSPGECLLAYCKNHSSYE